MDDRKRRIDELEKNKRESRISIDSLLENFGENLYSRIEDTGETVDFDDVSQYNKLQKDIANSTIAIAGVEEQNRRFRELEETIEVKEQEEKERAREISGIYRKLGKALLINEEYNDFTAIFREQADALGTKVESLESRITELENKEGGNVFSWIGKSAQGLVLRSFLSKAQENQEQLFRNIGERYSKSGRVDTGENDEVGKYNSEIEWLRTFSRSASDELAALRDEKRIISAGFGIDGSPQKQIQSLKNHISQVRDELRNLYKNFGAQAAGIMDADIFPTRKYFIDNLVTAEDGEIIGRAVRLNQSILDDDKAINRLRASLAIDEEKNKIEKYRRQIDDKKNRIAEFERTIADLEEGIKDSEAHIMELQNLL